MPAVQLAEIENELRTAVRERRYADTERLTRCYCIAAAERAQEFPPGDPRIAEITRQVIELLDWTHTMLCVKRAWTKAELFRIPFLNRYIQRPGRPSDNMKLDI